LGNSAIIRKRSIRHEKYKTLEHLVYIYRTGEKINLEKEAKDMKNIKS